MSIEFARHHKPLRELPLAAMIDVVFILIFFFMLTTSFLKIESMELLLPSTEESSQKATSPIVIMLKNTNTTLFAGNEINPEQLPQAISFAIAEQPDKSFLLLVSNEISMQHMVGVMDQFAEAGGTQLSVRKLAP